ncbi:probable terpene synthase 6 [Herrania umbratica]|uniref:(+)-delta-cadinene synthase n=1 Tax=Herrania umbratica TaxID=108875 RepID=A0A6J0ZWF9_9ROSI|nr:probable terpene synthase 6 [Herrania umbratica]
MANANNEVVRPLVNFPQDIWGDRFLSFPFNNLDFELCSKQVESMKEMVKDMLMASTSDPIEKIFLINSLYRLGVSYQFENEIEEHLNLLFHSLPELNEDNDYELYTVAVIFQVFRLHGYKMPCDVFSKFRDDEGKFKEALISDIKGMISLYEASHFRMNGELILDEALAFTTKHLESLANQSSPHLGEYIVNALFRPYHHGMERLEARQYISFYEKDESRNDVLLKFAKYDFNRIQLLLQQELSVLSSWYKELNLKSKFPYARHRIVECLFYALGIYFEPCYARGRDILAKLTVLLGFLDDAYEAYGLYEELQSFTDAIQRFDIRAMDELTANYQKILYETIIAVHDEAENQVHREGRSYSVSYTRDEFKKFVIAHQVEAQWRHEGHLPTFDEYLENGAYSSAGILAMTQILVGMEEADESAYEWIINDDNKISKALPISTRLYNDIVTNEGEEKRGFASGSACYMKQYNVSRQEAIKTFREKLVAAWKDINEGCLTAPVPQQIRRRALNFARLLDLAYRDDDPYTKPELYFKHLITKVLIDPIPL